jgi:hypothetical protein
MPFDAFNGSLVEQCLIHDAFNGSLGFKLVEQCLIHSITFTHSRKREGKITKKV